MGSATLQTRGKMMAMTVDNILSGKDIIQLGIYQEDNMIKIIMILIMIMIMIMIIGNHHKNMMIITRKWKT